MEGCDIDPEEELVELPTPPASNSPPAEHERRREPRHFRIEPRSAYSQAQLDLHNRPPPGVEPASAASYVPDESDL